MQFSLSSLQLIKGDVSTLIHQMELTFPGMFDMFSAHGARN